MGGAGAHEKPSAYIRNRSVAGAWPWTPRNRIGKGRIMA